MRGRLLIVLVALAAAGALAPAGAGAATIGFSEQQPSMFYDPLFQDLHVRHARLIVSWNAVRNNFELQEIDAWMFAASLAHVTPLVAFNHARNCFARTCKLPGRAQYQRAFLAFRKRYPTVKEYSPWNEANHFSQPTWRHAHAAATYYNVVRAHCPRCKIVALDVLDQGDAVQYVKTFLHYAKAPHNPKIWGLHNYSDTNRFRSSGTRRILRAVKGQIWLTETGGVVKFGRAFPYSPARAAKATSYMFRLAKMSRRISRLFIYQWTGAKRNARFDSGVIGPDGRPRPAYTVIRNKLGRHGPLPKRRPAPSPSPPPDNSQPVGPSGGDSPPSEGGGGNSGSPPPPPPPQDCPFPPPLPCA